MKKNQRPKKYFNDIPKDVQRIKSLFVESKQEIKNMYKKIILYDTNFEKINNLIQQVYDRSMWVQWYFKDQYRNTPKFKFNLFKKALLIKPKGRLIKLAPNIYFWNLLTKQEQKDLYNLYRFLSTQLALMTLADKTCDLNINDNLTRKEQNKNWEKAEIYYKKAAYLLKEKIEKGIKILEGLKYA